MTCFDSLSPENPRIRRNEACSPMFYLATALALCLNTSGQVRFSAYSHIRDLTPIFSLSGTPSHSDMSPGIPHHLVHANQYVKTVSRPAARPTLQMRWTGRCKQLHDYRWPRPKPECPFGFTSTIIRPAAAQEITMYPRCRTCCYRVTMLAERHGHRILV